MPGMGVCAGCLEVAKSKPKPQPHNEGEAT
jgi:hypothetical protein